MLPGVRVERRNLSVICLTVFIGCLVWYYRTRDSNNTIAFNMGSTASPTKFKYEIVKGFFYQDAADTNPDSFDYTQSFGLIPRSYSTDTDPSDPPWQRFATYIHHLASAAPSDVSYKLLYLGRHGEGSHNVAEAKYGTEKWDDYWSKLEGDGELFWADAHLTAVGEEQARTANRFVKRQLEKGVGMPLPEAWVVSPMWRCLQTAQLTWEGVHGFKPLVKELVREVLGVHTCDRRGRRSEFEKVFNKGWEVEEGLTEEDELWQADHRETNEEIDERIGEWLDGLFAREKGVVVSVTSHSGAIASHLRVLGHREFKLLTGGMIPVLVKATRVE
ncbi:phosphoglycerate mutase family protein [Zymoseptoria brevis]|uniref:Phosphoglycerate mutase family protein n=1 Tax=Zymoseptoria brevis TaxID=1047168 RepID=A0A0F4GWG7_9PEZI|nr:phosphoglycerate mutase family protein [Zymoseptoria brevis]